MTTKNKDEDQKKSKRNKEYGAILQIRIDKKKRNALHNLLNAKGLKVSDVIRAYIDKLIKKG